MPENGDVLTPKIIAIVGSSTLITRQRLWILGRCDRLADLDIVKTREGDDLAGARFGRRLSVRAPRKRTAL